MGLQVEHHAWGATARKHKLGLLPLTLGLGLTAMLFACSEESPLFTKLDPRETGIQFVNEVHGSDSLNILDYLYFYNGGGVAAGDLNNDGWVDLYFSANQGPNKLYLNKTKEAGSTLKFEDITDRAGIRGQGNWNTGVTLVDVNADGWLDIYLCSVGGYAILQGRNQLFINNGTGADGQLTFTERAREYGLDVEGFNTQATFFDYDRDGDLDAYIVRHSVHSNATYGEASKRLLHDPASGDKLLRNDSMATGRCFTDITEQAGMYNSMIGYGLNVMAGDLNNDGWDDVYVSNDFHENDYYYQNTLARRSQLDSGKAFREINRQAFGHESRFSMGSDMGDVNNDGWLDLITLDMLPVDEKILKTSAGEDALDIYQYKLSFGYHHQYARNCLQLNTNGGENFSDIALFSGISATDWSWSPLLADFDNDGIKDLYITNGIQRRPNDLDYAKYIADPYVSRALSAKGTLDREAIASMPAGDVHSYLFQGTDSLRFIDRSKAWGFEAPSLENGAIYADLDNDGDLDLVTNAVNAPAGVYLNTANTRPDYHFLKVCLEGPKTNPFGIGTKVLIKHQGTLQLNYRTTSRGFQSGSTTDIHFGLGKAEQIDSLEVIWPDGTTQLMTGVPASRPLVLSYRNGRGTPSRLLPKGKAQGATTLFSDLTEEIPIPYQHRENRFDDFAQQPLLPHGVSTQGPKIAVADVDGDGLEDFYVGGARGQAGQLFRQTPAGQFVTTQPTLFAADSVSEEVDALFFDANGDGKPDLLVVCGGNEFEGRFAPLLDRLYLNDGRGNFIKSPSFPSLYGNTSVAVSADFDRDGDQDLFIGGRVIADRYGLTPSSRLLINDGKGRFSLGSERVAPGLQSVGMVTDAAWHDLDDDGWPELIVAGEWMPLTVFKNEKGRLSNNTQKSGLQGTSGLWQTLHVADLDGDGDQDILAGNWGENTKLSADQEHPLRVYLLDEAQDGDIKQIMAINRNGQYLPFLGKEELEKKMPAIIRKKYADYKSFSAQTVDAIFGKHLENTQVLSVTTLSSMAFLNSGHGVFSGCKLPPPAQWAPIMGFATADVDRDGKMDILTTGNFYNVLPYEGRYDAGAGAILLGTGAGHWQYLSSTQSGWLASGEGRSIQPIALTKHPHAFLISRNNATIQVLTYR